MPIVVKLPDNAAKHLKAQAESAYQVALETFADDLLKEASRLEAAAKGTSGDPEITSTMVNDANILLRRAYARPRKSRIVVASQLISTVGGAVTGLLADMEKLKNPNTLI